MVMTGKERIGRILERRPVDRIGLFEHFWGDTMKKWQEQGHIRADEDLSSHFGFDMSGSWCFNGVARLEHQSEVVAEDEDTVTVKDGNYATLKRHKKHNTTPEHVDFDVKERGAWEELVKPLLKPGVERINFEGYRDAKSAAAADERFFTWSGVNVFECMHPVCGHEYMLLGMCEDPEWIKDMADTFAELFIGNMEILMEREGKPDGVWFYEDMGFKERPFMSPAMYGELIQPAHRKTIDFCHSHGLPVIMHSCGFIEPLLPGMVEAGIDCLQVIEIKAGMDPLRIKRQFGDRISLCGGMDARNLVANDIAAIDHELEAKIPALKEGFGYILHSDHSIPETCEYATYRHFVDKGLELGGYQA